MFPSTRIKLFSEDKLVIEGQCQLNNRHINFVQAILRAQFPKCDGLQNTLLLRLNIANKMVQILHIRNNHWAVISNLHCSGNDLKMYDTAYDDIHSSTMALLNSMLEESINVTRFTKTQYNSAFLKTQFIVLLCSRHQKLYLASILSLYSKAIPSYKLCMLEKQYIDWYAFLWGLKLHAFNYTAITSGYSSV